MRDIATISEFDGDLEQVVIQNTKNIQETQARVASVRWYDCSSYRMLAVAAYGTVSALFRPAEDLQGDSGRTDIELRHCLRFGK